MNGIFVKKNVKTAWFKRIQTVKGRKLYGNIWNYC